MRGYSLVELLIAVALQGIVLVMMIQVFTQVARMQSDLTEQKKSEETSMSVGYFMRSIVGQAVDLGWAGPVSLNSGCCIAGRGLIRQYDSYNVAPTTTADVDTIGVFWREWAPSIDAPTSQFVGTAIFYQRPTPTTSGVLYIDLGSRAGGAMAPSADDMIFDGLVGLSVTDAQVSAFGAVSSVRVRFTTRRYRDIQNDWRW